MYVTLMRQLRMVITVGRKMLNQKTFVDDGAFDLLRMESVTNIFLKLGRMLQSVSNAELNAGLLFRMMIRCEDLCKRRFRLGRSETCRQQVLVTTSNAIDKR